MYRMMDASAVTVILVMAAMLSVPFYVLWTYVVSGASAKKGAVSGTVLGVWGAVMTWFCLAGVAGKMGVAGNLVVPVCWVAPSVVLVAFRGWFLEKALSQKWLVGLQVWRVIGGVFLIEMVRGNLPGIFAGPAGVGDLMVGVLAIGVLLAYRKKEVVGKAAVGMVVVLGLLDLGSAFFFAVTSTAGPLQVFHPGVANQALVFPMGMIPLYLVPGAIFYHVLSWMEMGRAKVLKLGSDGEVDGAVVGIGAVARG